MMLKFKLNKIMNFQKDTQSHLEFPRGLYLRSARKIFSRLPILKMDDWNSLIKDFSSLNIF